MARASLREYLARIGFRRVEGVVSRRFELARIIAETEGCGPALVMSVEGVDQPVAANIIDTREKLHTALGVSSDAEAYSKLSKSSNSPGKLSKSRAPGIEEAPRGLWSLPAALFYEGEAGHYISSSIIIACYEGVCNASIHRLLVLDEDRAAIRIVPRHLWHLYRRARSGGEDLPVTIVIGVHPAVMLAAATSPPLGVFELEVAASLLGGELEVFESPIHGNPVPAGSGALVEARITGETVDEGPYVDAVMTYDRVRKQPVVRVDGVYVDPDEYSYVIMGGGMDHTTLMGFPREASIWEAVRRAVPRVAAVRLTHASGGWLHAVVSIEKQHEGDAKTAIMAAFAAHPSLKHVVVVDSDIDVDDPTQVEWAIATRFQAHKDLVVIPSARGSTLDPSSQDGLTSKMGIDATKPITGGLGFERGRIPGFTGRRSCG